jgi:hypothetical protein
VCRPSQEQSTIDVTLRDDRVALSLDWSARWPGGREPHGVSHFFGRDPVVARAHNDQVTGRLLDLQEAGFFARGRLFANDGMLGVTGPHLDWVRTSRASRPL